MIDIKEFNVDELIPYENNPRNNDNAVNAVAQSIKEFGFKVPVIVDQNKTIVAGHTRLKAAKKLGLITVPGIIADDLTPEQIKAFRLAENKVGELATWDFSKLENELKDLNFENGDFGFNFKVLDSKFDKNKNIESDNYDPGAENTEKKIKRGDVWKLGNHYLSCGDATNKNDVDRLLQGQKIDLVFTDPPYGINIVNKKSKTVGSGKLAPTKKYSPVIADDTTDAAKLSYLIYKDLCNRLIIWGGNYFTDFLDFSDGWLIWDKRGDMPSNNFADGEMAYCSFHTPIRIYKHVWNGFIREGENVDRIHPTQKPVEMLGKILLDFSAEGSNVLDVFGGSGSTLIACEKTNRRCFLMELDEKYCNLILDRWEKLTGLQGEKIND